MKIEIGRHARIGNECPVPTDFNFHGQAPNY
jgi:hypothetical protein